MSVQSDGSHSGDEVDERSSLLSKSNHSEGSTKRGRKYDTIQSQSESGRASSHGSIQGDDVTSGSCCNSNFCNRLYPSGFVQESKSMFIITWPIIVTQVCQMILGPISLIFCGHLGNAIQLDGAALAISLINATCIAVGQGLGTACDTFFSQTFGSSNKKQVGVYMQKAFLIFTLAAMLCFAVHINVEGFLLLIGQNPEVSKLAGQYMLIFIPGAYSFFMYIILSKYMQNQNIVLPNVFIGLIANGINALLQYLFIYKLEWGTNGSAIGQASAYFIMFSLTLLYILISGCYKETWDGWSTECLQDWGKFVRLCLPGMLMICMEWWGFEIGVFLTGLLGTTELGAQSVLLQIDSIWFQVPLGIQIATAIRVGQYVGAGQIVEAKTVGRLAITLVILVSSVAVTIFLVFQYQLPALFTNVEEVIDLTAQLLPIVAVYAFFDGVATACKGILYGTGRQVLGMVILFVSYYMLALPMGIPLMFLTDLRTSAYWLALAINLILQAIVLFIIVMRTDWQKQVDQAKDRAGMIGEDDITTKPVEEFPVPRRRQRLLSTSLSVADIQAVLKPASKMPKYNLVCRRAAAFLVVFAILLGAILTRLYAPMPKGYIENEDFYYRQNGTTVNWLYTTRSDTTSVSSIPAL